MLGGPIDSPQRVQRFFLFYLRVGGQMNLRNPKRASSIANSVFIKIRLAFKSINKRLRRYPIMYCIASNNLLGR